MVSRCAWNRTWGALLCFWREGRHTAQVRTAVISDVKSTWDTQLGNIHCSPSTSLKVSIQRHLSRNKGAGWCYFHPKPLSINTEPPSESNVALTLGSQHACNKHHHLHYGGSTLLSHTSFSPSLEGPSPRRPTQTPADTTSSSESFPRTQFCLRW